MPSETIVAVFETGSDAERAIAALEREGVPSRAIRHYDGSAAGASPVDAVADEGRIGVAEGHGDAGVLGIGGMVDPATASDIGAGAGPAAGLGRDRADAPVGEGFGLGRDATIGAEPRRHGGFWSWLTGGDDAPDATRVDEAGRHSEFYDRSVAGGRTVVTVVTDSAGADRILSVLDAHAPIAIEEHADVASGGDATLAGREPAATPDAGAMVGDASGFADPPRTDTGATAAPAREETLPLAAESIEIGKREIDRGTTRVRRYVVDRPFEEQVRLRDETVSVFRRPVGTGRAVGPDAFSERTVEMTETDEEAVVSKKAAVVEEVVLRKGVEERVETVHDTLRREEGEITGPDGRTEPGR